MLCHFGVIQKSKSRHSSRNANKSLKLNSLEPWRSNCYRSFRDVKLRNKLRGPEVNKNFGKLHNRKEAHRKSLLVKKKEKQEEGRNEGAPAKDKESKK